MEERFETFTVLITRISRSIKRIKADEMAGQGGRPRDRGEDHAHRRGGI